MWNSPVVVLMLVLATLYASLFHAVFGRSMRGFLLEWTGAVVGMVAGQLGARSFSWRGPIIGELHILAASVVAFLAIVFAWRLKV